jgi:hypothetical protein
MCGVETRHVRKAIGRFSRFGGREEGTRKGKNNQEPRRHAWVFAWQVICRCRGSPWKGVRLAWPSCTMP